MRILSTHPSDKRGTDALKRCLADIDAPGWCVAYGDRPDMLKAALDERYKGKKIVHVGGGETAYGDPRCTHPDHQTRWAITALSEVHLVANDWARENLDAFGISRNMFVTGCPSLDEIVEYAKDVAAHPHATLARAGGRFEWMPESPGHFVPTQEKRLSEQEFLERMATCSLFITNSSAGLREAPILGTPVIMIGDRQAGRAPAGTYHHPEGKACEEIARICLEVCK